MPYSDFWQSLIDIIYDATANELNTQEEIDTKIAEAFEPFYGYTDNPLDIPPEFKRRKRIFRDPVDLIRHLADGGVPTTAVFIRRINNGTGDHRYVAHISPTS